MMTKFHTEHDVDSQVVDTVACTVKVKVPDSFTGLLNDLRDRSAVCVREMLAHRDQSSSKYYRTIPSAVSKGLIAKYQRNKKCKCVSNVVIPICGDKGRVVKLEGGGIRIPAIFKKYILPVVFMRPVVGFVRSIEFVQRKGVWYCHISYNTPTQPLLTRPTGTVGVDSIQLVRLLRWQTRRTAKFYTWVLIQRTPNRCGNGEKQIYKVLGRGACFIRFATNNPDAQSTRITSCPNRLWTTPHPIVGALS